MIRNADEAVAAALQYIKNNGYATHQKPIREVEVRNGRFGVSYEMGFDYSGDDKGVVVFPPCLILFVRASDGRVMDYNEYCYEESRLRNEDDAIEALRASLSSRFGVEIWRLQRPIKIEDRPSGSYYVAHVLHGKMSANGEPEYDDTPVVYYLEVDWGENFTEEEVKEEDAEAEDDEEI